MLLLLSQVAHGELTEAPLETLSALAQSVFLPLLTARINQEGWPDVVAQEVSDSMHKLVATGGCRCADGCPCSVCDVCACTSSSLV